MGQKNNQSNRCGNECCHNFFQEFENLRTLDEPRTRVALTSHGEEKGVSDDILRFFGIGIEDERLYNNILLHIPHSSTEFPGGLVTFRDLANEERLLIDYYTDELFIPEEPQRNITAVVFPWCRLYCDVERLVNDPLEKRGLGITYRRFSAETSCPDPSYDYDPDGNAFNEYADWHATVSKRLNALYNPLLIDCHSFSSRPNPLNSNPPDIDICIGFNDDGTCPCKVVIGDIVRYFEKKGYKVGVNEPFSNSKTFPVPGEYKSVMIEVNKRLYMDEVTLAKTEGFDRLKPDIVSLYKTLLS